MTEDSGATVPDGDPGDSLTARELDCLLERLAPDRDSAGREYERIRHRLVRFLEWRGCYDADDLADEAMNRVARRLAEGLEIESGDPYVYFRGVAAMVFKEWLRQRRRNREAQRGAARESERLRPAVFGDDQDADPDRSALAHERLDLLRECLALLPEQDRDLVLRFYQGDGVGRIRQRRRLSRELQVSMSALRLKAFRIRRRLERCMQARLVSDE